MDEQTAAWHRRFATELFNNTWALMDAPGRSAAEDRQMLASAFASRLHWEAVGTPVNKAVGDWQISRVCALLGMADLAVRYASLALRAALSKEGMPDYMLASAYEGMARAHACAGDAAERERFLALANESLELIGDDEDRRLIEGQIASVPEI
ncbi:MAG: hypothetical protein ACRDJM_08005 [Actinomycetota bacterium]